MALAGRPRTYGTSGASPKKLSFFLIHCPCGEEYVRCISGDEHAAPIQPRLIVESLIEQERAAGHGDSSRNSSDKEN